MMLFDTHDEMLFFPSLSSICFLQLVENVFEKKKNSITNQNDKISDSIKTDL